MSESNGNEKMTSMIAVDMREAATDNTLQTWDIMGSGWQSGKECPTPTPANVAHD